MKEIGTLNWLGKRRSQNKWLSKYSKITRKGLKAYSTVSPNGKTRSVDIMYRETNFSHTELQMTSSVSQSRFLQRQRRDEVNIY